MISASHNHYKTMAFVRFDNKLNTKTFQDNTDSALIRRGYRLGKTIGEGSYSKVREAYKAHQNGQVTKMACKIINRKKASKDFLCHFLPRELAIIRQLSHPNLVNVQEVFEINDQVLIFMEICSKGDLLDYITNKGPIPELKARQLFQQMVSAVRYLHSYDISHRDLKCENILLKDEDTIRITDFGFARFCRNSMTKKRTLSTTFCGSAAYAAPEILQGLAYNPKMYDVWSLGCILYIMLTDRMPFDETKINKMLYIQLHKMLSFPTKCSNRISSDIKRFIMHLLEPDITRRATIEQTHQELNQLPPIIQINRKNQTNYQLQHKHLQNNFQRKQQKEMDTIRKQLKKLNIS